LILSKVYELYAPCHFGMEAVLKREIIDIGYEISLNKYFYRHKPLRSLAEVAQDILALEKQADGLISEILREIYE